MLGTTAAGSMDVARRRNMMNSLLDRGKFRRYAGSDSVVHECRCADDLHGNGISMIAAHRSSDRIEDRQIAQSTLG